MKMTLPFGRGDRPGGAWVRRWSSDGGGAAVELRRWRISTLYTHIFDLKDVLVGRRLFLRSILRCFACGRNLSDMSSSDEMEGLDDDFDVDQIDELMMTFAPQYRLITVEFLSTFVYRPRGPDYQPQAGAQPSEISFRLCGFAYELSLAEFGNALGLYTEQELTMPIYTTAIHTADDAVVSAWWPRIGDEPTWHEPGGTSHDLFFLYCILSGKPCNLARCLAEYFSTYYHRQERGLIYGGVYVTRLARANGLIYMEPAGMQAFAPVRLDKRTVQGMRVVQKFQGAGLRFSLQKGVIWQRGPNDLHYRDEDPMPQPQQQPQIQPEQQHQQPPPQQPLPQDVSHQHPERVYRAVRLPARVEAMLQHIIEGQSQIQQQQLEHSQRLARLEDLISRVKTGINCCSIAFLGVAIHQHMADKKQLILVVEGTAALGPYWQTIVSDYLEKVIRCFLMQMCHKINTIWVFKGIAFLLLQVTQVITVTHSQRVTYQTLKLSLKFFLSVLFLCQLYAQSNFQNSKQFIMRQKGTHPTIDVVKNPHYLVLVSETFSEAWAALSRSGYTNLPSQSPIKEDTTSIPPVSGPPPASGTSNASLRNRHPVSAGTIPPATVKEPLPPAITQVTAHLFQHVPPVARTPSQGVPIMQTSSPLSVSQEMLSRNESVQEMLLSNETVQEMKPFANGIQPPLRPTGPVNVSILNNLSQAQNPMSMHMHSMISSGMASISVPISQTPIPSGQLGITPIPGSSTVSGTVPVSVPGSFTPATSNMTGNVSQTLGGNLQGSVGMGQPVSGTVQRYLAGPQMVQSGMGVNQNMMGGVGQPGVDVAVAGTGTMLPVPSMSQQLQGMRTLGVNNTTNANVGLPQPTAGGSSLQSAQSQYVKVWEGNLFGKRGGQPVFIARLEGYRSATASES
ncbi:hypothetical protein R6Q57_015233 [Mikania cordata]